MKRQRRGAKIGTSRIPHANGASFAGADQDIIVRTRRRRRCHALDAFIHSELFIVLHHCAYFLSSRQIDLRDAAKLRRAKRNAIRKFSFLETLARTTGTDQCDSALQRSAGCYNLCIQFKNISSSASLLLHYIYYTLGLYGRAHNVDRRLT